MLQFHKICAFLFHGILNVHSETINYHTVTDHHGTDGVWNSLMVSLTYSQLKIFNCQPVNDYSFISAYQRIDQNEFHLIFHSHLYQMSGYQNYPVMINARCTSYDIYDQYSAPIRLIVVACWDPFASQFQVRWSYYDGTIPATFNKNEI